jgi:hypothetical protein
MSYCVVENTPGYLPDSDPMECEDIEEAKAVAEGLADELEDEGYTVNGNEEGTLYYGEQNDDDIGRVIEVIEIPDGAADYV